MESYQNILVVIDPTTIEQKALSRACTLAGRTGAKITAFLSIYDFSYEMTTMLSGDEREAMRATVVNDREAWLKDLIEDYNQEISCKVVWHNRPFEAILQAVKDHDFDVVLKNTHDHPTLQSVIFTPTDWHLIRKCWVPLLLIKEHQWPENGHILAAVNVGSEEEEHQSLNNKITEEVPILTSNNNSSLISATIFFASFKFIY
jgi:universal stress protein E